MGMVVIVIGAMLFCLGTGFYVGWICKEEHLEGRHVIPAPREPVTVPLRFAPRDPPTGELLALAAKETARFPAVATVRFPALERAGTR